MAKQLLLNDGKRRQEQWSIDQLKKNLDELNLTNQRNAPADGNCFFHCIADHLVRLGPGINQEHNVLSLRDDVVNCLMPGFHPHVTSVLPQQFYVVT